MPKNLLFQFIDFRLFH